MVRAVSQLFELSIAEAASMIQRHELSPVELVQAVLNRVKAVESKVHAFISVLGEQAMEVARAAERMIASGYYLGPLHGIPIGLKDNIYTQGVRTTAGSRILADFVPDEDATVTARLRQAGAIIIGKLNMHEFAWGGTTDNPHYGRTHNPWDLSRFPAGSSGGSGAAVAARECLGALGTDTGGSIRLPAAVNGIVGLRPTMSRVSNYNVVPLAWTMDTVGPMCRTARDCAVMFQAIAGYDSKDPGSSKVPVDDYVAELGRGVKGDRIGVVSDYFFDHVQTDVRAAVQKAIGELERAGAVVAEVHLEHLEGNISAQLTVESCEPSSYHQAWLRERPQEYGEDVRTLLELGELYLATHYIQAQRYRTLLRKQFLDAFRQVDVFISPTLPFVATPIGETKVVIEDGREEMMLMVIMQFTGLPSLTGLPAISVPCGFSREDLPIGMQIIGRPFEEARLFRIADAYQELTDWHRRLPNL